MQLIHLLLLLALVAFRSASAHVTTTTSTVPLLIPPSSGEDTLNSTRQVKPALGIIRIAMSVVIDIIKGDDDTKAKWVDETPNRLAAADSGRNVLVYHNQKSKYNLTSARHEHFELDKFAGTYGYEICVFYSGSFTLEGSQNTKERGWHGCKDDKRSDLLGPHIEFCNTGRGDGSGINASNLVEGDGQGQG
ncbi:hypothetical protein PG993_007929 [Apiospora rasikravindrae]|uniref:Uncharacterized protein n=1 Tax=Apiospora rasikravindrae TaxID=990691 RepID=A0ABR1SYW2_9PEZI